ncbi:MAG: hypothetical protein RBG13Loki_0401, partial [Promethearchaeota archaeon CR_4]
KLEIKDTFDVGFFNAYPEDTEFSQGVYKCTNAFSGSLSIFKEKAAVIIMSAGTEGRGYHSLLWETGAKLYTNAGNNPPFNNLVSGRPFGVFCPNVTRTDVLHFYPKSTMFHPNFSDLLQALEGKVGPSPKVAVFPTSIQLF